MENRHKLEGTMAESEEWLTVPDAARYSGYTQERLRQLAKGGQVQAQRRGWSWRIEKNSLDRHMGQTGYQKWDREGQNW